MVKDVKREIARWSAVPNIQRVIIHAESFTRGELVEPQQFYEFVNKLLSETDWQIGVAINPITPIEVLDPIADKINHVMLLGVNPGTSGQPMQDSVIDKIQDLRIAYPDVNIEVDGGVNEDNVRSVVLAGANIVCLGSRIFNNEGTVRENYAKFVGLTK
jgi:pentose-5-phosphate-3-epimerase